MPYSELKKGTFLIASPDITGGIFYRSVVLLCDHSPLGSLGLIINKPLDTNLQEEIFGLIDTPGEIGLRAGGPNQPQEILLLQDRSFDTEASLEICAGVFLNGDSRVLEEEENFPKTLLIFGYGGWTTGVLEREFLSGAWFLHPASQRHIFETPPETLWQTLLREMGGKYKTFSLIPENLDLN